MYKKTKKFGSLFLGTAMMCNSLGSLPAVLADETADDSSVSIVSTEDSNENLSTFSEEVAETPESEQTTEDGNASVTESDTKSEEENEQDSTEKETSSTETETISEKEDKSEKAEDVEKVDVSSLDGIDFSSMRLLVAADSVDDGAELSSYNDIHLLQYDSVYDAKVAYLKYQKTARFVDVDTPVSVADNTNVTGGAMTENANPIAELSDEVKDITSKDAGKIALIDTGADNSNVVDAVSVIGDTVADDNGHGSNMAADIVSQNPKAKIVSIKALDSTGHGTVSSVYAAIKLATEMKVDYINLSINGYATAENESIRTIIQEATAEGITVIGAAGNNGKDASYFVPANVTEAVVVGACDENGKRIASSNYGATVDFNVVAASTSEASAKMTGIVSKTGKAEIDNKLVFSTVETQATETEKQPENNKETIAKTFAMDTNTNIWLGGNGCVNVTVDGKEYKLRNNGPFEFMKDLKEGTEMKFSITPLNSRMLVADVKVNGQTVEDFSKCESFEFTYTTKSRNDIYIEFGYKDGAITDEEMASSGDFNAAANYLCSYDQAVKMTNDAKAHIGRTPYKLGARALDWSLPQGAVDCAGFVNVAVAQNITGALNWSANMYGTTYALKDYTGGMAGTAWWCNLFAANGVSSTNNSYAGASTGDIVITYLNGQSVHMGIYTSNGNMVHCCTGIYQGTGVKVVNNSIESSIQSCISNALGNKAADSYKVFHISNPLVYQTINKKSAAPEITKENSCYPSIYDENGKWISENFEGAEYGLYSDAACTKLVEKFTVKADGTANTVKVNQGTYYIKETKAPEGYLLDTKVYTVKPTSTNASSPTVQVVEDMPGNDPFSIKITKNALGSELAQTEIASLEGTIFEVKYYTTHADSVEELKDAQAAKTWYIHPIRNAEGQFRALLDEKYLTSFDGKQSDSLYTDPDTKQAVLPLGTLTVQEVQSADGYLKDNATIKATADGKDAVVTDDGLILMNVDKEDGHYTVSTGNDYEIGNYVTKVDISKTAVTGEDELPGAKLQITDKDGKVFEEWESGEKPHHVEGLKPGEEYTLTETIAPEGYTVASSIKFTVEFDEEGNTIVKEDGEIVDKIVMKDKVVSFTKKDTAGEDANEVEGAEIEVTDEEDNVVDKWVSTTEPHKINGLEVGKTYTMTETQAPDGYYYSVSSEFTVTDDGIDQAVEMIDNPIRYAIAKVNDVDGSYVKGVKLKLTDLGIKKSDEQNKPKISLSSANEDEVQEPAEYVDAPAVNGVEIPLPNDGITTEEPFLLDKELIAEHTYLLEEIELVGGVYQANSIQFTVPKEGGPDITTITMVDNLTDVSVRKVDNYGNPCSGAKLAIYETAIDEEGNISILQDEEGNNILAKSEDGTLAQFESTDDIKGIDVSKFVIGGKTYILREEETPFGFEQSPDVVFTVNNFQEDEATGKEIKIHQDVVMTDVRKNLNLNIVKVDSSNKSKKLEGAEFTLYTKDGKIAKDIKGKECVATTGKDGLVEWTVEYNSDYSGYFVKETKAPQGYILDEKSHEITVPEDYDFEKPLIFTIENTLKPENPDTSASGSLMAYMAAAAISAMTIVFVLKRKKSEAK